MIVLDTVDWSGMCSASFRVCLGSRMEERKGREGKRGKYEKRGMGEKRRRRRRRSCRT